MFLCIGPVINTCAATDSMYPLLAVNRQLYSHVSLAQLHPGIGGGPFSGSIFKLQHLTIDSELI